MSTLLVSPYEGGNQARGFTNVAFILGLIISLPLFFSSIISLLFFVNVGQFIDGLFPISAAIIAICISLYTRRTSDFKGVGLAIVALALSYAWYIVQISGLGLLIAITFALVLFSVLREAVPEAHVQHISIAAILAGFFLLLLDLLLPATGRSEALGSLALLLYLGIATNLLAPAYALRRFFHYSIREKLVAIILGVTLLALAISVVLDQHFTRQLLIKDANDRLESAASQTASTIDDFLISSLSLIKYQANVFGQTGYLDLPALARPGSGAEARAQAQLRYFRDTDPLNISSYAILNTVGELLLEYPPGSSNSDEFGQEYITSPAESGLPYASTIHFPPISGRPFLYFSAPILDDSNQIVGVILARYSANILQQLVARSTGLLGDSSYALVFDDWYQILAHGSYQKALYRLVGLPDEALVKQLQAQRLLDDLPVEALVLDTPELANGLFEAAEQPFFTAVDISNRDVRNQVGIAKLDTKPWQVAYFQPRHEYLAPIQSQSRISIGLFAVIMTAAGALGMWLARLLAGPVTRLEATASMVSQGDLSARALIEAGDEIGSLAASLNQVTGLLQEAQHAPELSLSTSFTEEVVNTSNIGLAAAEVQYQTKKDVSMLQITEQMAHQLASLNRFCQALGLAANLGDVFRATVIHLNDIFSSDQITVTLLTDETGIYDLNALDKDKGAVNIKSGNLRGTLLDIVMNEKRVIVTGGSDISWLQEFETTMISPLTAGGRTFGTLNMSSRQRTYYQEYEQSLFLQAAALVATAYEERRLFEEARQLTDELAKITRGARAGASEMAILNQLTQELSILSDASSIMRCAFRYASSLMQVEKLTIALHDAKEETLDVHVFKDDAEMTPALNQDKESGLIGFVIRERQPLLLADHVSQRMTELGFAHNGNTPRSWAGALLSTGKSEYGVIAVENYSLDGAFREHDLELLQAVAVQTAIAIKYSKRFMQQQARARREQIFREITTRVRSSPDVDSIMQTAAQEVGRALGRQTFVYLDNGEEYPATRRIEETRQNEQ